MSGLSGGLTNTALNTSFPKKKNQTTVAKKFTIERVFYKADIMMVCIFYVDDLSKVNWRGNPK